jgi:hypothetical protein
VIRGTDVKQQHEIALVDLCTLDGDNSEMNASLDSIFGADNLDAGEQYDGEVDTMQESIANDDSIVESMFQMWGDEIEDSTPSQGDNSFEGGDEIAELGNASAPAPAPWSSRSSPSGTFVRNTKTGKLEDIDT